MLTFFLTLLCVVVDARVTLLDGQQLSGTLVSIDKESVVLKTIDGSQTIVMDTLMSVELMNEKPETIPDAESSLSRIVLHDGSRLSVSAVTRNAQIFGVTGVEIGRQEIPVAAVRAVRLQKADPSVAAQWQTFLQREGSKDLLVVPKRDGSGLDFLAGIVSSISETEVSFLLDGDTIPVPIERVFGVVFARPEQTGLVSVGVLKLVSGDQFFGRSVQYRENQFVAESSWGTSVVLPSTAVSKVDFSSGRIEYLSDLTMLSQRFDGIDPDGSLFAGLIDAETAALMYGPRRDSTMEPGQKIRLRGQRFDKGLCLHSRTEISYALDRRFESFEAWAGVDDAVAFNVPTQVSLKISADGKVVFEKVFQASEDPVPVKLPMQGVSTLTILVDYADGDSTCDWLDLADARLIRNTEEK